MEIIINPLTNILYQSFYIQALYETFGRKNVHFGIGPFKSLSSDSTQKWGIMFVVRDGTGEKKVFIDGGDENYIKKEIYEWCDIYGTINQRSDLEKVVSLCPSYAVKCWGVFDTMRYALPNALSYIYKTRLKYGIVSLKHFLGRYHRLLQRATLNEITPNGKSEDDYVFFCATLWYSNEYNNNDAKINLRRAHFIRACKSIDGLNFEGGFVKQQGRSTNLLFDDCISEQSYSHIDWVKKTQKSALVFNTPAFWDCHGWKLGEYLALGKAIVSTPLVNDLPHPLEHGVNIHIVESDPDSIKDGVLYVLSHPEYRRRLEQGAIEYWQKWGSPRRTMELLTLI